MKKQMTRPQIEHNSYKPRPSVTFSDGHYAAIDRISRQKHVSIAWGVRDAVEEILIQEPTLFRPEHSRGAEDTNFKV